MDIITDADHRLAEQRQRHRRYLWALDHEPELSGWQRARSPWEIRETEAEPNEEVEVLLRDLADEILADGPRALLEAFVTLVRSEQTLQVLDPIDGRLRSLVHRASGIIRADSLRQRSDDIQCVRDAALLLRYAELVCPSPTDPPT